MLRLGRHWFFSISSSLKFSTSPLSAQARAAHSILVSEMLPTEISGDRRSRRRYSIHLPLHFAVIGKRRFASAGTGNVLNLSSKGIAFTSDETFSRGTLMELSISWPARLYGKTPIKLVVEGRVVRSDGQVTAVAILRHEFRTKRN